jgi:hypothetical protein
VGDAVTLEREPDNSHDSNAILVFTDDTELGYVPREEAKQMAPLLDAGATVAATVKKLWTTPDDEHVIPIIFSTLHHAGYVPAATAETREGDVPSFLQKYTAEPAVRSDHQVKTALRFPSIPAASESLTARRPPAGVATPPPNPRTGYLGWLVVLALVVIALAVVFALR